MTVYLFGNFFPCVFNYSICTPFRDGSLIRAKLLCQPLIGALFVLKNYFLCDQAIYLPCSFSFCKETTNLLGLE